MALPTASELSSVASLNDVLSLLQVDPILWRSLVGVMGDPGRDMRQVAALSRWAIKQTIAKVQLPSNAPLSVVQAAQLGLVWRSCRKALFQKGGGVEADFEDIDLREQQSSSTGRPTTPAGTNSLKKRKCAENGVSRGPDGRE